MNRTDSKPLVAIVDDDTSMLRALARLVQTAGYAVKTYASATEFLDDCGSSAIHCVVLDIQMPEMNGFELAAALAQRGVSVPLLYITAYETPAAREKAAAAHARGFLVKPFEPKQLLDAISDVLQSGVAAQ
jgi:two-component system response regulator FixJ